MEGKNVTEVSFQSIANVVTVINLFLVLMVPENALILEVGFLYTGVVVAMSYFQMGFSVCQFVSTSHFFSIIAKAIENIKCC